MQKYTDTVIKDGKPIAGLTVTVTNYPAGTPATIYAATGGGAVNSVLTDANGRFEFYAPNGHYSITVSGTGINPYTLNDIVLFDPADNGSAAVKDASGVTVQAALAGKAAADSPTLTGNVGVGVTPGAWYTSRRVLQLATSSSIASFIGSNGLEIRQNSYLDAGATERYISNGSASLYGQYGGAHQWYTAASGAAGGAVTFSQVMTLDTAGNLLVGVTTSQSIGKFQIAMSDPENTPVMGAVKNGVAQAYGFFLVGAQGYNAAACGQNIGKNSTTSRSINAGGTINASGADYAEYMTKADACGTIAKGQIVGVDADGKLTDKWAGAVSFLIKSTDPSYVGGDVWGAEESLGIARPIEPVFLAPAYTGAPMPAAALSEDADVDERCAYSAALAAYNADQASYTAAVRAARQQFDTATMPAYQAELATFEAALEAARQKVDRIAFCGQVPVNVTGGTPGQYVVPVQIGHGIGGQLVDAAAVTFDQYRRAVGIVQNVLPDGRANVRVKPV